MDRPGVWRRAGLGGEISGLDIADAKASLSSQLDLDFATRLLVVAERHFLNAHLEQEPEAETEK